MSTNRIPRLPRRRARALLNRPTEAASAAGALGRVLAAASAPASEPTAATDAELSAVLHFRAVTPALRSTARRPSMIKSLLTKVVATKLVAGAAIAAAATGGMALAAANGQFSTSTSTRLAAPASSTDQPTGTDSPTGSDAPVSSTPPADGTASDPTDGTAPTDSLSPTDAPTDSTPPDPSSSAPSSNGPSPSLHGLCVAYTSGVAASHGNALHNPAFSVLISAAGGLDSVGDYCVSLLGGAPTATGTDGTPDQHGNGNGNGNGHGNGHGNGNVGASGGASAGSTVDGHGNGHGNGGQGDVQGGLSVTVQP